MSTSPSPSQDPYLNREFVFKRLVDAPRQLAFDVWIDPTHLAQWWGPEGFTNPVCEVDARPGGALRIHMCGPDGTVYPMTGTFDEVVSPERLVFTSSPLDDKGNPLFEVRTTVTFEEQAGKTAVTVRARVLKTTPGCDVYLDGMEAGWTSSLERLASHLTQAQK